MRSTSYIIGLAWLAGCTGDTGVSFNNVPPEVTITQPDDEASYAFGADFELRADVEDDGEAIADLEYILTSDLDGDLPFELQTGNVEARFTVMGGLSTGTHTVQLQVLDFQDGVGEDSVEVVYEPNQTPIVSFVDPSTSGLYLAGDPINVRVTVTDDDDVELVNLDWGGAAAGLSAPATPDATGFAEFDLPAQDPGSVTLTVRATDTHDAFDDASLTFTVADDDADDDGHRAEALGGDDCDDTDAFVYPGADERCNNEDDDCDGTIDEGVTDPETWYLDADDDGHGDSGVTVEACEEPVGYVFVGDDCDDDDDTRYPSNSELCDGVDNDCVGGIPSSETTDSDADTYVACEDCDDSSSDSYPGASELCDGVDNDCDGSVPGDETTDGDSDGFVACADCDDANDDRFPGNAEACDGIDNDCDGNTPASETTDSDSDGYAACDDCDDGAGDVFPGATEVCDAVDQDCDGDIDDSGCAGCTQLTQNGAGGLHTYQFCSTTRPWHTALNDCTSWGYDYLTIETSTENNWVYSVINAAGSGEHWIGAADEIGEVWGWSDGTAFSYANWEPGEPNGGIVANCATIGLFETGKWNDEDCGFARPFICELEP